MKWRELLRLAAESDRATLAARALGRALGQRVVEDMAMQDLERRVEPADRELFQFRKAAGWSADEIVLGERLPPSRKWSPEQTMELYAAVLHFRTKLGRKPKPTPPPEDPGSVQITTFDLLTGQTETRVLKLPPESPPGISKTGRKFPSEIPPPQFPRGDR